MIDRIEPIPEKIPEVLRIAAAQRQLIPFIGAGASQLGGCPNWSEFADRALRFFVQEDQKLLNHAEFSQITPLPPRVKLSLALELEKKHEKEIDFKEILSPSKDKKEIGEKLYASLSKLATTFVTTNYDEWLDQNQPFFVCGDEQALPDIARQPFYKRKDITVENLDVPNAVFHIHGSVYDRSSMVMTTVDYLNRYSSHRIDGKLRKNPFLTFLQTLFQLKNVLFIGYGLNELEVLEYIIQKGLEKSPPTNESFRHYVLQGFFSHEIGLAQNLEKYYNQFGIGLIPFQRDERNYEQLLEVIDHLAQKIPPGPLSATPKFLEMEANGKTLELPSVQKLFFQRMAENQEQAKWGFDILLKRPNFAEFFDHLKGYGLFSPEHNSGPVPAEDPGKVNIPYWSALNYLSAVAKQAGQNTDVDLAGKVMEVIRNVSGYQNPEGHKIDNYRTWQIFAEILGHLPTNAITIQDLDLIPNWLDSRYDQGLVGSTLSIGALKRFLDSGLPRDIEKACIILDYCTAIKWTEDESFAKNQKKPISVVNDYWLKEIIQNNSDKLGARAGRQSALIFLKRIREIFSKNLGDLPTYMSRPAVEDHDQNHSWEDLINAVVEGFRDVLFSWVDHEPENATEFVGVLLTDANEMARRVGIYILNQKWPILGKLYSTVINPEFFNPRHIHELYHLLKDRFAEFNDSQKEATLKAIKKLPLPEGHDEPDRSLKYQQRKWLSAISEKGYEPADQLLKELDDEPNQEPLSDHPDFHYYSETFSGPGPSSYSAQELLGFAENKSLIEKLNDFQPSGSWCGPSVEALVDTLVEAVSIHPCGFIDLLLEFLKAKRPYQYGIINGFMKLWNTSEEKQQHFDWDMAWGKLIEFFEQLIGDNTFWKEPVIQGQGLTPDREWIPPVIAEFLHAGTRKDAKAYPPELLPRAFLLIEILLENLEAVDEPGKDAMSQAINSSRGKTIKTLFSHTLRVCRVSDKKNGNHSEVWNNIKPVFDAELDKCKNNNYEFSTLAAEYLGNIHYVSPGWLESSFTKIFPSEYRNNFICAIDGLAYSSTNKIIYQLLIGHEIMDKALRMEDIRPQARKKLIERIALACLWGDESIDSSRFNYIFESEKINDLRDVANFFYNVRNQELNPEQIERILLFWEHCINCAGKLPEPPKQLLSELSRLICYISEFTDQANKMLLAVSPHIKDGYNEGIFFKGLHRLVEQDSEKISMVLGNVLEAHIPNYDYKDMLKDLIIKIANTGRIEDALKHADRARKIPGFIQLFEQLSKGNINAS